MKAGKYLPSRQFGVIVASLALAAGLVYAAQAFTETHGHSALVADTSAPSAATATDWRESLASIQQASGISLPQAPDQNTVDALLQSVKSSNITDTISRSLLVNLTNAAGQGLGGDAPTQNQLLQDALSRIQTPTPKNPYTADDLAVVADSATAMRAYANSLATIVIDAGQNNNDYADTLIAIDAATTQNSDAGLKTLSRTQAHYEKIAASIAALPVPRTLEPFHLQLVKNFSEIASLYPAIEAMISDPVAGLAAIQQYNTLTAQTGTVFINIAQAFSKNDILFTKDEPGALWASFLQEQGTLNE